MEFQTISEAYQAACAAVKEAIKTCNFKAEYFIRELGFSKSPGTYYDRLKKGNWKPEELSKIGLLLAQKGAY